MPTETVMVAAKTEPSVSTSNNDMIQFKLEPHESNQECIVGDDDPLEASIIGGNMDDEVDDENIEDYSLMDAGDEPQPGTSADGTPGEGQGMSILFFGEIY